LAFELVERNPSGLILDSVKGTVVPNLKNLIKNP